MQNQARSSYTSPICTNSQSSTAAGWSATDNEDTVQRQETGQDSRAQGVGDDWQAAAGATLPMGKLGQPAEIADFIVFLASDRSGVVTGSVIDWDQIVIGGLGD